MVLRCPHISKFLNSSMSTIILTVLTWINTYLLWLCHVVTYLQPKSLLQLSSCHLRAQTCRKNHLIILYSLFTLKNEHKEINKWNHAMEIFSGWCWRIKFKLRNEKCASALISSMKRFLNLDLRPNFVYQDKSSLSTPTLSL